MLAVPRSPGLPRNRTVGVSHVGAERVPASGSHVQERLDALHAPQARPALEPMSSGPLTGSTCRGWCSDKHLGGPPLLSPWSLPVSSRRTAHWTWLLCQQGRLTSRTDTSGTTCGKTCA